MKTRPVGRIDFLDTKGQTGESCYYYSEKDFLKTFKEENYYGVPMVVNVFRGEDGQTIPLDFVQDFDPLPQGFKILDYKEGEDMNDFRRLEQLAKQYKALYPKGTRIELQMMGSDPRPIEPGTRGTVDHVDDLGTIHCIGDAMMISSDLKTALRNLKEKISDSIYEEWCDTLIACQDDRTLKDTLLPIVAKLTDVRIVNNELKTMLGEVKKEYWMMVCLVVGNIPLLYMLNTAWFEALMFSIPGKIVLAICGVVILITAMFMMKYTKPIEYKK